MVVEGQLISDGTAVWKVKKIGSEVPAGTMQMFAGNTIPAGWLLCDGSAVSRTNYAKLFSAIGTTWGAGDGSTTFNLPNSIGRFAEGAATSGSYKSAGLPNITGEFTNQGLGFGMTGNFNGAFVKTEDSSRNGMQYIYATNSNPKIIFNAANSNPIYGKSTTVQPPAFTTKIYICYVG